MSLAPRTVKAKTVTVEHFAADPRGRDSGALGVMYFDFANVFVFLAFGAFFVVLNVSILSRLLRPTVKDPAKETIYECGEPAVGSGWVRFDIRFYTVALIFLIFDVEVAFLYPWAILFRDARPENPIAHFSVPVGGLDKLGDDAWAKVETAVEEVPGVSHASRDGTYLTMTTGLCSHVSLDSLDRALVTRGLSVDDQSKLPAGSLALEVGLTAESPFDSSAAGAVLENELSRFGLATCESLDQVSPAGNAVDIRKGYTANVTLRYDDGRVSLKDLRTAVAARPDPREGASFVASLTPGGVAWFDQPWRFPLFVFLEMLVFIGILLVGFVYVWAKGDLSWIKTMSGARMSEAK